jgi:cytochrome bd-type quinol oxidase subunit 2
MLKSFAGKFKQGGRKWLRPKLKNFDEGPCRCCLSGYAVFASGSVVSEPTYCASAKKARRDSSLMDHLPGFIIIAGSVLVLLAGLAVIAVRIVHGRKAVEDWPGWACWGGHIIFALSAFIVAAWLLPNLIADSWPLTKSELAVTAFLAMVAMVGGYFFGVWFIGEGKDDPSH